MNSLFSTIYSNGDIGGIVGYNYGGTVTSVNLVVSKDIPIQDNTNYTNTAISQDNPSIRQEIHIV